MRSSGQKAHSAEYDSQGSLRPYSRSPEAQIVAFAKAGDNVAFAELVQRNYARIFRLAYSITRNFGLAGDAVGEAFYKAFEHLSQFESVGLFSSWLNRIVVNECNETARTNRRAISVEFEEKLHSPELRPESWHTLTPEEQTGYSELLAVIYSEISRIPAHLGEPLLMRMQDKPIHRIALEMGLSESAVKSRVNRARRHLRMRLGRHLPKRLAGV